MLIINDILLYYFGEEQEIEISEAMGIRSIAGGAFESSDTLRSIVIDDSVEEIGKYAFADCSSLVLAVLPEGLEELSEGVFAGCCSLEHLKLPKGFRRIGQYALLGCGKLVEISIPDTVTSIGEDALAGTGWYQEAEKQGDLLILDGFLIGWTKDEEQLVIPDNLGIVRTADCALGWKEKLERVVLPEGLTALGEKTFFFCRNLSEIEFPDSIEEIGRGAMAATAWMDAVFQEDGPYLVNGIDISY